jgi:hypothetical protein
MTRSTYGLDAGTDVDWRLNAACRLHPPDWWTAPAGQERDAAVRVCAGCPVRTACLMWAYANVKQAAGAVYAGRWWTTEGPDRSVEPVVVAPKPPRRLKLDDRRAEVEDAAQTCSSVTQMALTLHVSIDTVYRYLQARGIAYPSQQLVPCGTHGAYERHRWRGEPIDEACAQAQREYDRERAQTRQRAS